MLGSWIGAILAAISVPFGGWAVGIIILPLIVLIIPGIKFPPEINYLFAAILGFLIGWGIHSLIRGLRK